MSAEILVLLIVSLGLGIPVLVGTILFVVFTRVGRSNARARAALEEEGVVLDSGPQWITIRYNDFRAPGVYKGLGITKSRASFVLTKRRLVLAPGFQRRRYFDVDRSELGRFAVGITEDGKLHIHSDQPPHATGSIDYRVAVANAGAWVRALTDAGAQPRPR